MMSRHTQIGSIVAKAGRRIASSRIFSTASVLLLITVFVSPACSTAPPGSYSQSAEARQALQEFPEVARNCELPEAFLQQFTDEGRRMRLLLPAEIYSRRDKPPVQGRIACVLHWASERELKLLVLGMRR